MKKSLAIVSYSRETANIYKEQIESLRFTDVDVEAYCLADDSLNGGIEPDVLLILSYDGFTKVEGYLRNKPQILFISRTISKIGYNQILNIEVDENVYLMDETMSMAKNMVAVLMQLGLLHINLVPIDRKSAMRLRDSRIIVLGKQNLSIDTYNQIIDIGSSLIDMTTLIDVTDIMDMHHLAKNLDFQNNYREFISANFGLSEMMRKANQFEGEIDLMMQIFEFGVVVLDINGDIMLCNDSAMEILQRREEELQGVRGEELFSQLTINELLNGIEDHDDKLIKINGNDIVAAADSIKHSDKIYGVIIKLGRFSESERKQHETRMKLIRKGHKAKYKFEDILGLSDAMVRCKEIAERMSYSDSSVLIIGESGTGKELFAHAIHNQSKRHCHQFVAVNCGAFPENLLESELFGYDDGAFTGARKGGKKGLFELAHKGTLFLDEIGAMPYGIQTRLLRALQEREVRRVGGDTIIKVDIRVIAATNTSLEQLVEMGEFREDLYYRMNVLPLSIPPLRNRVEDIDLLLKRFGEDFNVTLNYSEEVKELLIRHQWKGNVRELRNYVEYLANLNLKFIDINDLPDLLQKKDDESYREEEGRAWTGLMGLTDDPEKYLYILEELDNCRESGIRAGRRSLSIKAKNRGLFISEKEMRRLLLELESKSLVRVYKGRSGTVISDKGKSILKGTKGPKGIR
jgi:transcriptional regulator with PAS, ATPase and Fis domain